MCALLKRCRALGFAQPVPLSAEEVVETAVAEELTLKRDGACASGYAAVHGGPIGPFQAYACGGGNRPGQVCLGSFRTAEQAALALARDGTTPSSSSERQEAAAARAAATHIAFAATASTATDCRSMVVASHAAQDVSYRGGSAAEQRRRGSRRRRRSARRYG